MSSPYGGPLETRGGWLGGGGRAARLQVRSRVALITTLAPGSYTVQLSGVAGATGIALVEVYELP